MALTASERQEAQRWFSEAIDAQQEEVRAVIAQLTALFHRSNSAETKQFVRDHIEMKKQIVRDQIDYIQQSLLLGDEFIAFDLDKKLSRILEIYRSQDLKLPAGFSLAAYIDLEGDNLCDITADIISAIETFDLASQHCVISYHLAMSAFLNRPTKAEMYFSFFNRALLLASSEFCGGFIPFLGPMIELMKETAPDLEKKIRQIEEATPTIDRLFALGGSLRAVKAICDSTRQTLAQTVRTTDSCYAEITSALHLIDGGSGN